MGGEPPDTSLAWSPDGMTLAIGTSLGEVLLVDLRTGRITARRRFQEAVIKGLGWSPSGDALLVGEQSPDAMLRSLNPGDLGTRWERRLAEEVESSAPPPADDLYGLYTLPAVYGLEMLSEGRILVAAVHAWSPPQQGDAPPNRRNLSRLLLYDADGGLLAAWPRNGAADATLMHPKVSERSSSQEGLVVVPVGRSASGPPPADLPINGLAILTLPRLELQGSFTAPPLRPWFQSVFAWDAVDVDAASGRAMMGLGDGRLFQIAQDGQVTRTDLGAPFLAGDVPIAASIGFGVMSKEHTIVLTSRTNIPYGSASPATRPPTVHPRENSLFVLQPSGVIDWMWRGPPVLAGLSLGEKGRTLLVGAGPRQTDEREDLFGALLFDLQGEGSGEERLISFCATESPAFFNISMSESGFIAIPTHPWVDSLNHLRGSYEVAVFH